MRVIFGTGAIGLAVMDELVQQGNTPVTLVNRSGEVHDTLPAGVRVVAADLTDAQQVRRAAGSADTVYLCAAPPYDKWPQQFPPLITGLINGLTGTDTRVVFADNLYMYGDTDGRPLREDMPENATTRKGQIRAYIAQMLRDAPFPVAIGRASDYYGARGGSASMFGDMFFEAVFSGGTANFFGDIQQPHDFIYVCDVARGLVTLGQNDDAFGETWHLPCAGTLSTRELVDLFEDEIGQSIQTRTIGSFMARLIGIFTPILREFPEMMYQWEKPFRVDDSKFRAAFKANHTPHLDAVAQTIAWYQQHRDRLNS